MESREPSRRGGNSGQAQPHQQGGNNRPQRAARGGGAQGSGVYMPPHLRNNQSNGEGGPHYNQGSENHRGGRSGAHRGRGGDSHRGRGAGGRGRGGHSGNTGYHGNQAGQGEETGQPRSGAGGLFILIRGEQTAKRLTKVMNMRRLELEPDLAAADRAVKAVLAGLSQEEQARWDDAIEKMKPKEGQFRGNKKPLQAFWRNVVERRVREQPDGEKHLATLHKCEYVAYFCCSAADTPQNFAREIIKTDPKTSKYPDAAADLERAYQASVTRFNMLIQDTAWKDYKHDRQIQINDFGRVYSAAIGSASGCSNKVRNDLFYIIGIEPPSIHALFNGYPGDKIDFSVFKGKSEPSETTRQVAARETSEEANIAVEVLREALDRVKDDQIPQSTNPDYLDQPRIFYDERMRLTLFPVVLDLEQGPLFKKWLQDEEERLQLNQVVAQMASLTTT